jgi:helicase
MNHVEKMVKKLVETIKTWYNDQLIKKNRNHKSYTTNKKVETHTPKKTTNMMFQLEAFLNKHYLFRYNQLTEETEYSEISKDDFNYRPITQRELNSFCIEVRKSGIECWDRDISRYINSIYIKEYHPFKLFMDNLPIWDGKDRIEELACRVSSTNSIWIKGFHRWMLALSAQWMGMNQLHANSVAPVLISPKQGKHKSTFCKSLLPEELQRYYTDSYDLNAPTQAEQKLSEFGLINLDEMDKISIKKMALLKNLIQMAGLNIRKAHKKNYHPLPRIASFIATSNRKDLLTDPTGSRRFLCIEITEQINCSNIDHQQIYAQLKAELLSGNKYWFDNEEEAEIMRNNASFCRQDMETETFFSHFRNARKDEPCLLLSSSEIFNQLKKMSPATMKNSNPYALGRMLTVIGTEKVHTETGNVYRVISI